MLPVRNFISLATMRKGSTTGMSPLTRATALLTMLPATETAAAHAESLLREGWYRALDPGVILAWRGVRAVLRQSEHLDKSNCWGSLAAAEAAAAAAGRALRAIEAPV